MPGTRPPCPSDFRGRIIAPAGAGRGVESLAREFEPCAAAIAGRVRRAGIDGGASTDGPTGLEREEPSAAHGARHVVKGGADGTPMVRETLANARFARDELGSSPLSRFAGEPLPPDGSSTS